jgi:sorting nexin-29
VEEQMSEEWNNAITFPIYQNGNKMECNNYRGILLLNLNYKVPKQVVSKYLEPYVEEILGDYQSGFRRSRITTNRILSLRITLEKSYVDVHQLYRGYKEAYDSINKDRLTGIMKDLDINGQRYEICKDFKISRLLSTKQ